MQYLTKSNHLTKMVRVVLGAVGARDGWFAISTTLSTATFASFASAFDGIALVIFVPFQCRRGALVFGLI